MGDEILNHFVKAAAFVALLGLGACVATVTPASLVPTTTSEPVSETNYVLGVPRTAVVGDQVVRVKDYTRVRVSVPAMTASASASWTMGLGSGSIEAGAQYPIAGERLVDGTSYRIVEVNGTGLQVLPDGSVHNKGLVRDQYGTSWIPVVPALNLTGPVRFTEVTRIDESSIAAGENYEIVFTGRDAGAMRFQYREYTSEDMARAAFSQDLTYPVSATTIRFRGLVIDVLELGPDSIRYKVVSRGPRS